MVATVQVAELTSEMVEAFEAEADVAAEADRKASVVLELSNVKFLNSVALGALVALLRRIKRRGGRLALAGLSGHCLNVMNVTGMGRIFELREDVPSAMEAFKRPV